jgi:WD40 repeat protein
VRQNGEKIDLIETNIEFIVKIHLLENSLIAIASKSNVIQIWNLEARKNIMTLTGHTDWVLTLEMVFWQVALRIH